MTKGMRDKDFFSLKTRVAAISVILFVVCPSYSADPAIGVDLVVVGNVSSVVVSRVQEWVSQNFLTVRGVDYLPAPMDNNPLSVVAAVSEKLPPPAVARLGLVGGNVALAFTNAAFSMERVALVFVEALATTEASMTNHQENYLHRVEAASISGLCTAIGLEACPFPRCALFQAANERELDSKARNLCPPCSVKARASLSKKGVAP